MATRRETVTRSKYVCPECHAEAGGRAESEPPSHRGCKIASTAGQCGVFTPGAKP